MKKLRKISHLVAATAGLSLACANGVFAWSSPFTTQTVRNDHGGRVLDYAIRMNELKENNATVKFDGRCDSACTLLLALPSEQTCVTEHARFGFHLPFNSNRRGNAFAATYMMNSYPGWVQDWLTAHGGLTHQLKVMTYRDASQHMPVCDAA